MDNQLSKLDSEQHQALVAHISRHLDEQDDQTLMLLSDLLRDAPQSIQVVSAEERSLSRRRFLTATLSSGFVAATAGAVAVWQYGNGRGQELSQDLERLWGLVRLYQKLDDAGLDHVVEAGIAAVGAGLEAFALAADAVKAGVEIARDALIKFESAFPAIRAGITWLEGLIADIGQRLRLLEDAIGRAVNEVSPLTQALAGFFGAALNLLPPEVGQRIKDAFDRISEIIVLLPNMIADINVKVLTPFRNEWFSDTPGKGVRGGLIDPIITKLLDPSEALLGKWSELVRHWEADLTAPTRTAVSQRAAIRQEIADYKSRFGLHEPAPNKLTGRSNPIG